MEEKDRRKIIKKWEESGLLDDSNSYEKELKDMLESNTSATQSTGSSFDGIAFPIVKKVAAQTIGGPTVTEEERNKVIEENRIGKIRSIIEDIEFEPKEVPEVYEGIVPVTPMGAPNGNLFYIDFNYDSATSSIDT